MRIRLVVKLALLTGAVSALLFALPSLVDWWESPCMPTSGFPGKAIIDKEVQTSLGGCFVVRGGREGVVVQVYYYMSDAEARNDPEIVANTVKSNDQLYSVIWQVLPFKIGSIEIRAKDIWGAPSRRSVVTAKTLEAKFGPRPASLRVSSNLPATHGEKIKRIGEPIAWVLVTATGILLVFAATRAVRQRRPRGILSN